MFSLIKWIIIQQGPARLMVIFKQHLFKKKNKNKQFQVTIFLSVILRSLRRTLVLVYGKRGVYDMIRVCMQRDSSMRNQKL